MTKSPAEEFSSDLGMRISTLRLIQENKYCFIFFAVADGERCIIKKYKGVDSQLVKTEAEALSLYHKLAVSHSNLMDSGIPILREDKNLLVIGFIEGDTFSRTLYKAWNRHSKNKCVCFMRILGALIAQIYHETQCPNEETSPFIFEYLNYSSRNLESLKFFRSFFSGAVSEATKLETSFRAAQIIPSFVHGDFVFKNIHVNGNLIGLIDFANANYFSHPLNDIYNLRFALENMFLSRKFKSDLIVGFIEGLGDLHQPETSHKFYYEYHRRRWLMLKLSSRNPLQLLEGIRGLGSFARPFGPEVIIG